MRTFDTGATRDTADGKLCYAGFLSPRVLRRYAEYMHAKRKLPSGNLRDPDNWKRGIPLDTYMDSGCRHFMAWWEKHEAGQDATEELCALLFNAMGYLHEQTKPAPERPA